MDFWIRSLLPLASLCPWTSFSLFGLHLCYACLRSDLDPQFMCFHQSDSWTFQPFNFAVQKFRIQRCRKGEFRCLRHCFPIHHVSRDTSRLCFKSFDSTLGYPGEGPTEGLFSLVSANVGSVLADSTWKTWDADCICLQETRVGKNNHRSASKSFQNVGFTPCFGDMLPGLWYGNKSTKTPCGGTLVAGGSAYIQAFDPCHDVSGLYTSLFQTKRVVAAWIQATPKKKALVVSVYATTSASQDHRIHEANNKLFDDIFLFLAQFGRIPIILAGDLQAPPMSYPAISNAISFQSWHDPVTRVDEQGELIRPLTFSNDGTFAGVGEGCTSIDAVLVNDIAFAALREAEVLEICGKQHRPIKLVFEWATLNQTGFHVTKAAPLVLDDCTFDLNSPPPLVWEDKWKDRFDTARDSDAKWDVVNSFLQDTLLAKGARWGTGKQVRGAEPVFVSKTIAPKQLSTHCAANRHSVQIAKLCGRLNELFVRLSRDEGTAQDAFITQRTADKACRQLHQLSAPISWPCHTLPTLTCVYFAKRWAEAALKTFETQLRAKRIKSWKNKIHDSSKQGCAYIFHHLKNKQLGEPTNLVVDDKNNILFQPDEALKFLNQEWDQVYSANLLSHHPLKMLETVWPYIQDKQIPADLPCVSGSDLYATIQQRKSCAAPGLDGWRTPELQSLTPCELQPVANFFELLETSALPLPKALACAKQVILNKPGPSTALNKRLITILPAILLAYTGARFRQLQLWQQTVMPPGIILGGIKGRFMSDLYNQIRLDIDDAKHQGDALVGIKLDKAKAFDRVVPQYVAALFIAFGIPKGVTTVFVKMYDGLHRHLSYRSWMSPSATTASNGVCQGCSLSLLAINVYNKVRCHLLDHLPQIFARAYIDDSYLWCRLQHVAILSKAVELTRVWDLLSGQKLNEGKSSMWGTNSSARQAVRSQFPEFPIVLELDVLGTKVYTSERPSFGFSDAKLRKILQDTENIAALPVPKSIRSFLIGAKIIPQFTFGAHITKIPKKAIKAIQNAIAKALWAGQPMWRSKQLLQCILSQPHRTEPIFAGAYLTILEVSRLCFSSSEAICQIRRTWQSNCQHSLAACLHAAFETLGIQVDDDLCISFLNSPPAPFFRLSPKDLKKALQNIVRQACYSSIDPKSRKDFCKVQGIFDFQQTARLLRSPNLKNKLSTDHVLRLENVLVGCTLTNDRLAASGWVTSAQCRFCAKEKESLAHLIECPNVREKIGDPVWHEFGSNFAMLGHYVHPNFVARRRLQFSDVDSVDIAPNFCPDHTERVWTDGSVVHADKFWITNAAYAILDEHRNIRHQGVVFHWAVSAYIAEFWAIIIACASAAFPTTIFCDCKSVVDQAQKIFANESPGRDWTCHSWWCFLQRVVALRRQQCDTPFKIVWIPAHCFEGIPVEYLTPELAASRQTTLEHILHNRLVDAAAKSLANRTAVVVSEVQAEVTVALQKHQRWLIDLHEILPTHQPDRLVEPKCDQPAEEVSVASCQRRFPSWLWSSPRSLYTWAPKIPNHYPPPPRWSGEAQDWHETISFLRQLRWMVDDSQSFSFNELAVIFDFSGFRLVKDRDLTTYHDIYRTVRDILQYLNHDDKAQAHPGIFNTTKPRCCGRVLPQGCIEGAIPFVSDAGRVQIARLFTQGAGRSLASWKIPLSP